MLLRWLRACNRWRIAHDVALGEGNANPMDRLCARFYRAFIGALGAATVLAGVTAGFVFSGLTPILRSAASLYQKILRRSVAQLPMMCVNGAGLWYQLTAVAKAAI